MASVHRLCFVLFILPSLVASQNNISLGMSLSASQNSSWLSPSGDFAFGFRPLPNTNRSLLAIWFDKLPDKTIVWSPNRNQPVLPGSHLNLTHDGHLLLTNHQSQEIWRAPAANNRTATSAAMLDNGNFVLIAGNDPDLAWESFWSPTDTLLPGQVLHPGTRLSSRESETSYATGRFELDLSEDGKLVLIVLDLPVDSDRARGNAYWESDSAGWGSDLVFNESGFIYLRSNASSLDLMPRDLVQVENYYCRAMLGSDGVFWLHTVPKTGRQHSPQETRWNQTRIMPPNPCMVYAIQTLSGICGYNSYCEVDEGNVVCRCPIGYTFRDPKNLGLGCKQERPVDACRLDQSALVSSFEIVEMPNVDWPLADFERYNPFSEEECRAACLDDCFCAVAIHRGRDCWKKKTPLSNGRADPGVGGKALIKVWRDNSSWDGGDGFGDSCKEKKRQKTIILVGSVFLGGSVFLNLSLLSAIFVAVFFSYHRKLFEFHKDSSTLGRNLRAYTYKELEKATDGFKEEVGRGAFGSVYKGVLASDILNLVAIKKLEQLVEEGETEFKAEVRAIGQTHHKHLVRLLGFCDEGPHRLLVYEYMSNGSLASFLFKGTPPSWNQRMQIAICIARGLSYLHEECNTPIIHCDIKPQNILLDDSFTPKISDFGLAKLLKTDQSRTLTGIRGTKGYVAAEWFKNVPITAKVDAYSFGVVLLELVCCRKNVELGLEDEEKVVLTDWAWDCYAEGRLDWLVNKDVEALEDYQRLQRVVTLAFWCIQEDPSLRPSMKQVTEMLEGVRQVPHLPDLST